MKISIFKEKVSEPSSNNRISSYDNVGAKTPNGFLHFTFIQRIDLSDHIWYIDKVYILGVIPDYVLYNPYIFCDFDRNIFLCQNEYFSFVTCLILVVYLSI